MVGRVLGGGLEGPMRFGGGEWFGELCGEGELCGDGELPGEVRLRGDWRGECWGKS